MKFSLLAICALGLGGSAAAQDVVSVFDTTNEGWRVFGFSYTSHVASPGTGSPAPFDASDGQPAGSLRVGDVYGETCVSAPPAFVGDKSAYYGGELRWDIRVRYTDAAAYPAVMLRSATKTLFYVQPSPPLDVWTTRSVALTEPGWTVNSWQGPAATPADMQSVLSGLEHVWINTEWKTGPDDTSVDNVRLVDPHGPVSYCTSGTTSNGCLATVSATANPSLTAARCTLAVSGVEGQQSGIVFYGLAPLASPWGSGPSFLCVKAPLERTGVQGSGGTAGACDGTLALDWDAYQAATPGATGQPWLAGQKAYVQGWFRDPPSSKTTSLSNALELTYSP